MQHNKRISGGAVIHPAPENHILTTETAVGAYNVYGSNQGQNNNRAAQRHSSTGVKNQGASQSKLLNDRTAQAAVGGYLNTQPNYHGDFDTEMS